MLLSASSRLLQRSARVGLVKSCDCSTQKPVEYDPIESRRSFKLPPKVSRQKWFPRHMSIQFDKMEARLRSVDLVIEVHDARIALTGRNDEFQSRLFSIRPHILVFNKRDLISYSYRKQVEDYYRGNGVQNILWTDCKNQKVRALTDLQHTMLACLRNDYRFNRHVRTEYLVMVVGIPNVGKSSLINSLRTNNLGKENKAVTVGARPGVTVRVQNRVRIMDVPPIYILDTPGVLSPSLGNLDDTMKLALCETILETTLEKEHMADYLLYWMNKHQDYSYLRALGLECQPTDDLKKLLLEICRTRNLKGLFHIPGQGKVERWNLTGATELLISTFRRKKIADCFLDKDKF